MACDGHLWQEMAHLAQSLNHYSLGGEAVALLTACAVAIGLYLNACRAVI